MDRGQVVRKDKLGLDSHGSIEVFLVGARVFSVAAGC